MYDGKYHEVAALVDIGLNIKALVRALEEMIHNQRILNERLEGIENAIESASIAGGPTTCKVSNWPLLPVYKG